MNGYSRSNFNNYDGFSLIELIIALAILGLLAAISIPTLRSFFTKDDRQVFVAELNIIVSNALDNAIISEKTNRVVFNFVDKKVFVEQESDKRVISSEISWERLSDRYIQSEFDWSKINFEFRNFFIDSKDELLGTKKEKTWFYISPEGAAQPVILNLIELGENLSQADSQFSLVLNPFNVQFKMYEKFIQPS
jgi:prepilin-type N-terminal cleavage/methylation domain-containing protein